MVLIMLVEVREFVRVVKVGILWLALEESELVELFSLVGITV